MLLSSNLEEHALKSRENRKTSFSLYLTPVGSSLPLPQTFLGYLRYNYLTKLAQTQTGFFGSAM